MKVTLFTVPKMFDSHFKIIQDNAIRSWLRLIPQPEIIIFGEENGFMDALKKYPIRWLPYIKRNKFGTPLLNSVFEQANRNAHGNILIYVNSDIILDQSLILSLEKVRNKRFLVVGRRWNLNVKKRLVFGSKWDNGRDELLKIRGELFRRDGLDYFAYPNGTPWNFPPFAIGRTLWDNWIPFRAKQLGLKVIDASDSIIAIHQQHDYSHAGSLKKIIEGPERKKNASLAPDRRYFLSLHDADYVLGVNGIKHKKIDFNYLWRRLETLPVFYPKTDKFVSQAIEVARWLAKIKNG